MLRLSGAVNTCLASEELYSGAGQRSTAYCNRFEGYISSTQTAKWLSLPSSDPRLIVLSFHTAALACISAMGFRKDSAGTPVRVRHDL